MVGIALPTVTPGQRGDRAGGGEQLGLVVDEAALHTGLRQARLAGRMQRLRQQPSVIVDVAHNPHSAHYLAQQLRQQPSQGRRLAVAGMLKDKDILHTLGELSEWVDVWYLADLQGPRAATANELAEMLPLDAMRYCYDSVRVAYQAALATAGAEDEIIVLGSFYTVADVMAEELDMTGTLGS